MPTLADLITAHAADLGDDYPAIAALLNAPTSVDNPRAGEKDTADVYPTVTLPSSTRT